MATPEKALFDSLYLAPAKSGLFAALTEIELPKNFNSSLFKRWVKRIKNKSRRHLVEEQFMKLRYTIHGQK